MIKTTSIFLFSFFEDEREARENVKREQDEAYRLSLEADRAKVGFVKVLWNIELNPHGLWYLNTSHHHFEP
jgi:hypothetical protein